MAQSTTQAVNMSSDFDAARLLAKIRKELGSFKAKAPSVLRSALNTAAVKTKKALINKAKEKYAVAGSQESSETHMPVASNKTFKLYRASAQNLSVKLLTRGAKNEIGRFKVSSRQVSITGNRPRSYKGKVLRNGRMTSPMGKGINRWFWVRFKSGHMAMVKRDPARKMFSNDKKDSLKVILGPQNALIYGTSEMQVLSQQTFQTELNEAVRAAVKKTLASAKTK